ncbi:MAG TPA: energy transducer TonB, partial [Chitinophagales bacterium]|nr:energy transducer TonB [Chitinophagales bacterium]
IDIMKYFLCIFLLFTLHSISTSAQVKSSKTESIDYNRVYEIVDVQPKFPGGLAAMMAFIQDSIRYPEDAIDNGIEGTAIVQFIVERDGSITDIQIVRDPGGGLGREAERIIKLMPKWEPGKQRDNPVRVKMSAPVRFRLSR